MSAQGDYSVSYSAFGTRTDTMLGVSHNVYGDAPGKFLPTASQLRHCLGVQERVSAAIGLGNIRYAQLR